MDQTTEAEAALKKARTACEALQRDLHEEFEGSPDMACPVCSLSWRHCDWLAALIGAGVLTPHRRPLALSSERLARVLGACFSPPAPNGAVLPLPIVDNAIAAGAILVERYMANTIAERRAACNTPMGVDGRDASNSEAMDADVDAAPVARDDGR